jgi:hypothetical protein
MLICDSSTGTTQVTNLRYSNLHKTRAELLVSENFQTLNAEFVIDNPEFCGTDWPTTKVVS